MSPASNHVLLTGGAGFIGSHVSEALLRRGVQLSVVDCLDDFYSPAAKRTNLEEVRKVGDFYFCQLDLCDFDRASSSHLKAAARHDYSPGSASRGAGLRSRTRSSTNG